MKTNSLLPLALLFKSSARYIKRKRFVSFLILAFVLCINVSAQNSANLILQPASTTTTVGQSFTVNVRVDFTTAPATSSVDVVEVHVAFDKTKLAVTNITKPAAAVLPSEAIPLQSYSIINNLGKIDYNAGTTSNFPNADFDFLTITFNVISGAGSTTPLTFLTTFPNKTDAIRNFTSILGGVSNGTVDITTCTPPAATISATTGASICNGQPVTLKLETASGVSPYTVVVNGVSYPPATVGSTLATVPFPTYKIWPATNPGVARQNDGVAIETGNKFRSSQTGFVKGVRFYAGSGSYTLGTFKGKLWNYNTSQLLATVTYTGVTPGGWVEANFSTPVSIAANTTYLVTTYSSVGNYAATDNYFGSAVTSGPLTALANSTSPNGIYITGTEQTGITNFGNWAVYQSTNYWADVIFVPNTNSFTLTSVTDASGCNVTGSPLQTVNVLSVDCSSLPVTLLNLSAAPGARKVTLRWATSSEINNRGFDVQRSDDGMNWTTVGFVAGSGNSNSVINYSYLDNNLDARKYYYRLKQIDIDDRYKFSMIVSATLNGKGEFTLGQNYPNPFLNQTTIQFSLPQSENVNLSLYDANGRMLKVLVNAKKEAGTHAINVNTENLTKGIYFYRMMAGDFFSMKKMTIQ